jgi:hypothetical protein
VTAGEELELVLLERLDAVEGAQPAALVAHSGQCLDGERGAHLEVVQRGSALLDDPEPQVVGRAEAEAAHARFELGRHEREEALRL